MSWPDGGDCVFVNASHVVTCAGPSRARRGGEMRDAAIIDDAAVLVRDGRIAAVAPWATLRDDARDASEIDCGGRLLTPGLVDSHTHALFGRARYEEQELRATGVGYMEIARRGGGIHASVRDLRARSLEDLVALARPRLMRLASYGTTTVEVKSGYGLTLDDELKSLRAIAKLATELPLRLVPTFLGAHEIPLEFRERPNGRAEYMDLLIQEMLPRVQAERLARFADVFC